MGTLGVWALLTGCVGHVGGDGKSPGGGASQTNGGTGSPAGSAAGANTGNGAGVGAPGAPGSGAGTTTGMGSTPTSGTTPGAAPAATCTAPQAAAVRLRLLSGTQYDNTVLDLLQVGGDPAKDFGDQVFEQLDDTRVEQRANAAAAVAHQAATTLSTWSPCSPPTPAAATSATTSATTTAATSAATTAVTTCEQQIIDQVGASAFRHPLAADERASMKTLFDAGITEKDFTTGVEWFLTGVLQSPDFMYEIVKPAVGEVAGEVRPIAPYEYASRLSYFMWDSLPDAKLFAAAAADELGDPAKRQVQLQRMIADPRFMRGVERFYSSWLNVGAFGEVARDAAGFTGDVVTALSTSLLMSATQLYAADAPNFSSLFSGETYYMNDVLRTFYNVPGGSGTGFTPATLGGQGRHGIVTHPALMALLARPAESFPIARGLFVLRSLLCMDVPPPPAGLTIPQLPAIQDGLSTRHRLEAHVTDPACNTCHKVFDPPGLALESFDEVGRYRTIDHGAPVDTSATIALNSDLDGSFSQGDDFLARMTSSVSVRSCFSRQVLEFALSRQSMDPADACSLDAVAKSFAPSGDLKQLVASVASSDAFRLRLAEGVAP